VGFSPTIRCDSGAQKRRGGGRAETAVREQAGRGAFYVIGTQKTISLKIMHWRVGLCVAKVAFAALLVAFGDGFFYNNESAHKEMVN